MLLLTFFFLLPNMRVLFFLVCFSELEPKVKEVQAAEFLPN